jgi:hypothetical protein
VWKMVTKSGFAGNNKIQAFEELKADQNEE